VRPFAHCGHPALQWGTDATRASIQMSDSICDDITTLEMHCQVLQKKIKKFVHSVGIEDGVPVKNEQFENYSGNLREDMIQWMKC
jgi:hypothetical protein